MNDAVALVTLTRMRDKRAEYLHMMAEVFQRPDDAIIRQHRREKRALAWAVNMGAKRATGAGKKGKGGK